MVATIGLLTAIIVLIWRREWFGCYYRSCYEWGLFLVATIGLTIGLGYNLMIVKFYSIKLNQPHAIESWEREKGCTIQGRTG